MIRREVSSPLRLRIWHSEQDTEIQTGSSVDGALVARDVVARSATAWEILDLARCLQRITESGRSIDVGSSERPAIPGLSVRHDIGRDGHDERIGSLVADVQVLGSEPEVQAS